MAHKPFEGSKWIPPSSPVAVGLKPTAPDARLHADGVDCSPVADSCAGPPTFVVPSDYLSHKPPEDVFQHLGVMRKKVIEVVCCDGEGECVFDGFSREISGLARQYRVGSEGLARCDTLDHRCTVAHQFDAAFDYNVENIA